MLKQRRTKYKQIAACVVILLVSKSMIAMKGFGDVVPYSNIRYENAFDQDKAYAKYAAIIRRLGCARNVFPDQEERVVGTAVVDMELNPHVVVNVKLEPLLDRGSSSLDVQQVALYEQECIKPLKNARTMALAEPGVLAVVQIGVWVASAVAIVQMIGSQSMGGRFAIFTTVSDMALLTPSIIKSGYQIVSRPNNPIGDLEDRFARNKCYIPRVLWPKIMKSFEAARENQFSREAHIDFLENALSLTTYKSKPTVVFKNNMSQDEVKSEINRRITEFFNDYKHAQDDQFMGHIKINCSMFVDAIVSNNAQSGVQQAPTYVYLHGPGGIGKTHFVQTLSSWIDELIPNSIHFEDVGIQSADELEGNATRPGALLNVLRKQLMQNKRGSIVIFDDAIWLKNEDMVRSAKRVLKGDRLKLSTAYFGHGIDGSALSLEILPMLTIVANNDPIKDLALDGRFDTVIYPSPALKALVAHAMKAAGASSILKQEKCVIDEEKISRWVQSLHVANKNFRYVAEKVENNLLAKKRE